jgi:hypothetical protein
LCLKIYVAANFLTTVQYHTRIPHYEGCRLVLACPLASSGVTWSFMLLLVFASNALKNEIPIPWHRPMCVNYLAKIIRIALNVQSTHFGFIDLIQCNEINKNQNVCIWIALNVQSIHFGFYWFNWTKLDFVELITIRDAPSPFYDAVSVTLCIAPKDVRSLISFGVDIFKETEILPWPLVRVCSCNGNTIIQVRLGRLSPQTLEI